MADPPALPQMVCELDAEQSFNYVWKADLLERALAEVRRRYTERGMEAHWHVFQDRLLGPTLEEHTPPPLGEICQRYGITDEATASNMLYTVKKLVRSVLKDLVRQTVVSRGEMTIIIAPKEPYQIGREYEG